MSTVTFTQGANVCAVTAKVVYGTDFADERLNQFELETSDGSDVVYDNGPTIVRALLVLKDVSYTHGAALRTWLSTYAVFAKNTFTVSALTEVDLGLGKNTAITSARFDGKNNLRGVFEYTAPGIYNVKFPYKFTRT